MSKRRKENSQSLLEKVLAEKLKRKEQRRSLQMGFASLACGTWILIESVFALQNSRYILIKTQSVPAKYGIIGSLLVILFSFFFRRFVQLRKQTIRYVGS
jgi:hypothetical protein